MKKLDKLNQIAMDNSNWEQDAKFRKDNRNWQKYAQKIGVKVLRGLRKNKMTQEELAEHLKSNVAFVKSIVKGKANLTLKDISTLEKILKIKLL